MRIHGSGIGTTFDEALADLGDELETASVHAEQVSFRQTKDGKMEAEASSGRMKNPFKKECLAALASLSPMVEPVEGHKVRILVSGSNGYTDKDGRGVDKENAHIRLEIDLIRS